MNVRNSITFLAGLLCGAVVFGSGLAFARKQDSQATPEGTALFSILSSQLKIQHDKLTGQLTPGVSDTMAGGYLQLASSDAGNKQFLKWIAPSFVSAQSSSDDPDSELKLALLAQNAQIIHLLQAIADKGK